ncbi:hypothetical protein CLV98_11337 [Dyadobacter jejuensis]|uniref:Uncharacterized protein n=1 Tax=Dyadobacter jejuensis TaxID=1082580 RepID=A0A316AD50_9BACT|nr:hypothetical protein [Dyadobacter jejuensis]PWJ55561.1 hypothetical protein CLV98_11337 [Dyadobacter jejuensis]
MTRTNIIIVKPKIRVVIGIATLILLAQWYLLGPYSAFDFHRWGISSPNQYLSSSPFAGKDPCEFGPKIMEIFNITPQGARVTFHGVNVFGLNYKVYDPSNQLLTSANLKPTSSLITIGYPRLQPGKYRLVLSATTCEGKSEKYFTIPHDDATKNSRLQASNRPQWITKGMDEHLDLRITGEPGNWLLEDFSSPALEDGYEFRYMINSDLVKQSTPLHQYPYQSDSPIRVWKMKTKTGLESVNRWSDKVMNYFFSTDAGKTFSYNVTAGIYTGIFPKGPSKEFIDPIPDGYDPNLKTSQWADLLPPFKLPKGHVFFVNRGEWPVNTMLSQGVTHISHFQLPWEDINEVHRLKQAGLTYFDVQRLENFLQLKPTNGPDDYSKGYNKRWWPHGPFDQQTSIQKANEIQALDAVWIGETLENASWIQQDVPMWGWFYKRLRERYEAEFGSRDIPYYICHNYFQLNRDLITKGREKAKRIIRQPESESGLGVYLKGGTLTSTNLITTSVYLGAPDDQVGSVYKDIYDMILNKSMGYEAGIFLAGFHEWKPNNLFAYHYPEGTFYTYSKLPLDPNVIINYAFLSQVYGKVFVEWGGAGKQTRRDFSPQWAKGLWFPDGTHSPQEGFPYYSKDDGYYSGYNASIDLSAFGIRLYTESFGRLQGNAGSRQYLPFRIDKGPWIQPAQEAADEVVDAYYDRRGFVYSQSKGGKTAWFYLNSFADNKKHLLEVKLPNGRIESRTVAGNSVHVTIE